MTTKYKRFHTILKESGYEGRPVEFLQQLMARHSNVRDAADEIHTTHATLYDQLKKYGLAVEKRGLVLKPKE